MGSISCEQDNAAGVYADDNSAVITGSAGSFRAATAPNGNTRFYRIRRGDPN